MDMLPTVSDSVYPLLDCPLNTGKPASSTSTATHNNPSVPGGGQLSELFNELSERLLNTSLTVGSNNRAVNYHVSVFPAVSAPADNVAHNTTSEAHEPTIKQSQSEEMLLNDDIDALKAKLPEIINQYASSSCSNPLSIIPKEKNRKLSQLESKQTSIAPSIISKASGRSAQTLEDPYLHMRQVTAKDIELPKSLPDYIRTYTRVLSSRIHSRKHVICLWSPDTNQDLTQDLQEKHCTLGDVGMFDSSGNFEVFFNIFMSREENIRMRYRPPENFQPLEVSHYGLTKLAPEDNTHFSTTDFRSSKVENKEMGHLSLTFESIKKPDYPGGAILALPSGYKQFSILKAVMYDISIYLERHVDSWYATTNHWNSGNILPNGALLLISSCYKSLIWGAGVLLRDQYRPDIPIVRMERLSSDDSFKWKTADTPIIINHGSTKEGIIQIPYTVAVEVFSVYRNNPEKKRFFGELVSKRMITSKISLREKMVKPFNNSWSRFSLSSKSRLPTNRARNG